MTILIISAILLASYLIGSTPTSYLFGRYFKNLDIREYGSKNVGATNALRVLGTKIGVSTLIIDIAKGFVVVYFGKIALLYFGFEGDLLQILTIVIGFFAILGHIFTIYLKFKGGKGVATSAGVFLALSPIPFGICFAIFIIVVAATRYVSLGSILAAISLFSIELFINIQNEFSQKYILIFITLIALFIIVKHTANIKRLLAGNENKISFKK